MKNFDDAPIITPNEDRFGFDPFARAVADCIRCLQRPVGSVVAVYGPWGSGKSSVINLVRHHLQKEDSELSTINFPAWMYKSEDALSLGFFKELYSGLAPVLSKQKKAASALKKLGANLSGASNLVGIGVGLFAGSLGEKATTATLDALGSFISQGESSDELQEQLASALREEGRRFLIVIDDLDRLSPEEALVVFRLVKSVGRLPNVMYLMAYDRANTEAAIANKFPSEGAHYLEKIVQAGFELPEPDQSHLNSMFGEFLDTIVAELPPIDPVEFGNLFHSIVAPELKTPRDVLRLANTLSITSAPIRLDVFMPDFVSIETLRLFRPRIYSAVRSMKAEILNGADESRHVNREERQRRFSSLLLGAEPDSDKDRLKEVLMRLFPQLQSVFANTFHTDTRRWTRDRRVCAREHFDTYFRFAVSKETIPRSEVDYILSSSRSVDEIQSAFKIALGVTQGSGRSKASYIFDEIIAHGETTALSQAELILKSLFEMADAFLIDRDKWRGFSVADNRLRLHWLLRAFLRDRTNLEERSEILMRCCEGASLVWLIDFSNSAWEDHYPRNPDRSSADEREKLLTLQDAARLRTHALEELRKSASDGRLLEVPDILVILFDWDRMKGNDSTEVMDYTNRLLMDDLSVARLASACLGKSYSYGMGGLGGTPGDVVYRENDRAQVDGLERIMDVALFRERLIQLSDDSKIDQDSRQMIVRFQAAWDQRLAGGVLAD